MAGTLNRRGVFLKKLAAADLEFLGAQAAALAERGRVLAINATIAEAVLPREARRRGIWTAPGRNFFCSDIEQISLSRALDWQLSGITPEHRSLSVNDWFAARYEVDDEGQIAFVWRTIAHNVENNLWFQIENNVSRHLVAGMVHFSSEHPEHDMIDAIVFSAPEASEWIGCATQRAGSNSLDLADDPLIEPEIPATSSQETAPTEHAIATADSDEVAPQNEPAPEQSEPEAAETVEFAQPVPISIEQESAASETPVPVDIKDLLKIDETRAPIIVGHAIRAEASKPVLENHSPNNPDIPSFLSERAGRTEPVEKPSGRPRWKVEVSALGIILLAGFGIGNREAVSNFACGKAGVLCAKQVVADVKPVVVPAVPKEEPKQIANTEATPLPPAVGGPLIPVPIVPSPDEIVWSILQDTKDPQQLQTFISRFPSSSFRGDALTRLAALEPRITDCDVLAAHPLDLGKVAEVSGVKIQFINASLATQACERAVENFPNEVRFQLQLGRSYEKAKNFEEAHKWYAKAAALGYPQAMHNLGFQFATGQGAPLNFSEARNWFNMAAVLGNAAAMTNLGQLYAHGLGVPRDYKEASNWYLKAANANIPLAMTNLGSLYLNGRGVSRDYGEARRWYKKAADLGSAKAMFDIGSMYQDGLGVSRSYREARKWYVMAAENGSEDAKKALGRPMR